MRFISLSIVIVMLAGCAATPTPVAAPARPAAPLPERERGDLIGLDANALATRLGQPRLQVREGAGTKLQFVGGSCVLDAYLYPPAGGGTPRVEHVDTRGREGRSVEQNQCIAMIETP